MKICIFAKYLPVHIKGGMEFHVQDLIEGLIQKGHKVTVITSSHPEKGKGKEEKGDLTIYYLNSEVKYFRERFFRESAKLFKELNRQEDFDIVHSQSNLGYGYIKYLRKCPEKKIPLVTTSHGTSINEIRTIIKGESDLIHWLAIPFHLKFYLHNSRILYKEADKVITVSKELKEDIIKQYKIGEGKIKIIPNGVDTDKFKPLDVRETRELRKSLSINKEEKVIMSCGVLRKQKGFHLLIKILPDLLKKYEVKLLVVGNGPYLKSLKKLASKLKIRDNVVFTGSIDHEKLPRYYSLSDVFSFPSQRKEGLPYVVLEAMSCQLPVVTSKIGGIPTAIQHDKDGILIEPGNKRSLKKNIAKLFEDPDYARRLSKNGREKILEHFSVKNMTEQTIRVYKDI